MSRPPRALKDRFPQMNERKPKAKLIVTTSHQTFIPATRIFGQGMVRIVHPFRLFTTPRVKDQASASGLIQLNSDVMVQPKNVLRMARPVDLTTTLERRMVHLSGKLGTTARTIGIRKVRGKVNILLGMTEMVMIHNKTQQHHHGDKPKNRLVMHFEGLQAKTIIVTIPIPALMLKIGPELPMGAHMELNNTDPIPLFSMIRKSGSEISATAPRRVV